MQSSEDERLHNRRVSAIAYEMSKTNEGQAREYWLQNTLGTFGSPKNYARAIKKWGPKFQNNFNLDDAPRSGRPSALDPATILRCVGEFLQGRYKENEKGQLVWLGWESLNHAIKSGECEEINMALNSTGICSTQLWRRMVGEYPQLCDMKRTVTIKAMLTPEVKAQRKLVAGQHRRLALWQLLQTVWIDAKKLYVTPEGLKVYGTWPFEYTTMEDPRLPQGKSNTGVVLYYFGAVNALLGVVYFTYVTGTTGVHKGYERLVS